LPVSTKRKYSCVSVFLIRSPSSYFFITHLAQLFGLPNNASGHQSAPQQLQPVAEWLSQNGYKTVSQEVGFVDIEFTDGIDLCRAELKTTHGTTIRKAIREALGQLLEYNYYGDRKPAARWMIVLDRAPSDADLAFLRALAKIPLPIGLAWRIASGFKVERVNL
jgi:hypothetical protein